MINSETPTPMIFYSRYSKLIRAATPRAIPREKKIIFASSIRRKPPKGFSNYICHEASIIFRPLYDCVITRTPPAGRPSADSIRTSNQRAVTRKFVRTKISFRRVTLKYCDPRIWVRRARKWQVVVRLDRESGWQRLRDPQYASGKWIANCQ